MKNYQKHHFLELDIPDLVNDIRKEFNYINSLGVNKHKDLQLLKTVIINRDTIEYLNLKYLFDKYPFLYPHILIFSFPPGTKSVIHKDGVPSDKIRFVSINIPISGCSEDCLTEFFNVDDNLFYEPEGARSMILKPDFVPNANNISKAGHYALKSFPIITDTQKPHRINNLNGKQTRVSVSWTTQFKSWESAFEFFSQYAIR